MRLVFFGDSICVGQYVPTHETWVSLLSARLRRVAEAQGVELSVANASVNGNTTRAALERMPQDVQKDGADLLLVQFGLNDCNYWQTDVGVPRVSPKAFAANLEEIVERGRRCGASRVLLNSNHPSGRDQDPLPGLGEPYERSNERYNEIVRSVAQQLGARVVFTDVEAAFKRHTAGCRERLLSLLLDAPDLIHLSKAGHAFYAEILGPVVERALLDVIGEGLA
jgi:lysophospholipase L1-like esterase